MTTISLNVKSELEMWMVWQQERIRMKKVSGGPVSPRYPHTQKDSDDRNMETRRMYFELRGMGAV
jgi:hypothetical protein